MDASGPLSLQDLDADLDLRDAGDNMPQDNSDEMVTGDEGARTPTPVIQPSTTQTSASKRPLSYSSDGNSGPSSPTPKFSKHRDYSGPLQGIGLPNQESSTHRPAHLMDSSRGALSLGATPHPAFAPREKYVKLLFKGNLSVDFKHRWLSEVTRAFHLDRDLAEVKMSAITSRFVYISRRRSDIIDSVTSGEFLSLSLEIQDSPDRPRKFPTYLLTRYPVFTDPALAKNLPGVYTARRFLQNGKPINRLVITWSLPQPPPSSFTFSFLPCLPPCEFRQMKDEQPWCYRCWNFGHISRYCSAPERCAYCSEAHDSRTCPHRAPKPPTLASDSASLPLALASDSASSQPHPSPAMPDTSHWKCPRCHQPGVTVWHQDCPRGRGTPAPTTHTATRAPGPPPPPPPHTATPSPSTATATHTTGPPPPPPPHTATPSPQVTALRDAVATLQTRVTSLMARFDTIEARLDSLVSKQATIEITLNSLTESQTTIIKSISELTERLTTVASHLDTLNALPMRDPPREAPPKGARVTATSSSSRRPPNKPVR